MAGGKPISYRKSVAEELNASRRPQSQDRTGSDHGPDCGSDHGSDHGSNK